MTEIDLTPITRLEYDIDAILNDHAVAEPITRIELILADIVAGNTTTVVPVTRIETYLAIISGADYPVPEPVTRIETFLAIIAGEDYETPEAVTRLEGLLAEWVEKGSGIWKTVTGTLLHITDALASPMQKCEVTLEPVQDLHGQDAPYPAGGGVNKLDPSKRTIYSSGKGLRWYENEGYLLKANQPYTFSVTHTSPITLYIREKTDGSYLVQESSVVSYTATEDVYVYFQAYRSEDITSVDTFQLELGSTATPYKPYSNICPITGWTGCEVNRTGNNLLAKPFVYYSDVTTDTSNYFFIKKGTYTFSFDTSTASSLRYLVRLKDRNGNIFSDGEHNPSFSLTYRSTLYGYTNGANTSVKSITLTIVEDCYIRILYWQTQTTDTFTGTQLELGSTATDYEPYSGTTLSVTFPDGQTVYGGKYDFISGEGDSKLSGIVFDGSSDENWTYEVSRAGYKNAYINISNAKANQLASSKMMCNMSPINQRTDGAALNTAYISGAKNFNFTWLDTIGISSAADFKTWLTTHNIQVVYELANPVELSLSGQTINTLQGENNIWADCGDTTIIYKAQSS